MRLKCERTNVEIIVSAKRCLIPLLTVTLLLPLANAGEVPTNEHTRKVLQLFGQSIPPLRSRWHEWEGDSWEYCKADCVSCNDVGSVTLGDGCRDLTGSLPEIPASSDINGDLVFLTSVSIRGSALGRLTGALPSTWSQLTKLTDIDMSNHDIKGTIPSSWAALSNLELLSLPSNHLSGSLPTWITALPKLWYLDLEENRFTGQLPEQWSVMDNLTNVNLADNTLVGSLPESWSRLASVDNMGLSGNSFCGCMPSTYSSALKDAIMSGADANLITLEASDCDKRTSCNWVKRVFFKLVLGVWETILLHPLSCVVGIAILLWVVAIVLVVCSRSRLFRGRRRGKSMNDAYCSVPRRLTKLFGKWKA